MVLVAKSCSAEFDVKETVENEIQDESKEIKPEKTFHKLRDSLLSLPTSYGDFRGFVNLFLMILILSNAYISFENAHKYGIVAKAETFIGFFVELTELRILFIFLSLNNLTLCSFGIEVLLSKGVLNESLGVILIIISLTTVQFIPVFLVRFTEYYSVGLAIVLFYEITFLKLVSYHVENHKHRKKSCSALNSQPMNTSSSLNKQNGISNDGFHLEKYPNNLNLKNFYYFLFAPSLCYELNVPRTPKIRVKFLARLVIEMACLLILAFFMLDQNLRPTILGYQDPTRVNGYFNYARMILKCMIITYFLFCMHLYITFHLILNIGAEIMRFGDRQFYECWWNALNMRYFWQHWNSCVHKWCSRHLYLPLLKRGFSELQATSIVFFISALHHEYTFSIPSKPFRIRYSFFLVMLAQIPLVHYSSKKPTNQYGNVLVWLLIAYMGIIMMSYFPEKVLPNTFEYSTF